MAGSAVASAAVNPDAGDAATSIANGSRRASCRRRRGTLPVMPTFLLHGDTIRHPAIRHEVPLEILDPFLVVIRDDAVSVLTSSLEAARLRAALPGAELLLAAGIAVEVDAPTVAARRRVKTPAELDGIRRAQRAAEAGMAVAERLIRGAEARDGLLHHNGGAPPPPRRGAEGPPAGAPPGAPPP